MLSFKERLLTSSIVKICALAIDGPVRGGFGGTCTNMIEAESWAQTWMYQHCEVSITMVLLTAPAGEEVNIKILVCIAALTWWLRTFAHAVLHALCLCDSSCWRAGR